MSPVPAFFAGYQSRVEDVLRRLRAVQPRHLVGELRSVEHHPRAFARHPHGAESLGVAPREVIGPLFGDAPCTFVGFTACDGVEEHGYLIR